MTTPFPKSFNIQIAENSILDYAGQRQVYLGNQYILPWTGVALSDTSEDILALITNPATSTKSLFLNQRKLSTDNNNVIVKFYAQPTYSAIGTLTAPMNLRTGYSTINTSVAQCGFSPTVSNNGTLLAAIPATVYSITSDLLYCIDPGYSFLLTGKQESSGTTNIFVELTWYEY